MRDAMRDVQSERTSQIAKGYGPKHDDYHFDGSIARAASLIAADYCGAVFNVPDDRPEGWESVLLRHVQEKYRSNSRQKLVIAAAMIVAEIERIDRLTN